MSWDPEQYLRYAGHRIRPAVELLQRVDADPIARVVDLGCGTGNTTALLAERWPAADLLDVAYSNAALHWVVWRRRSAHRTYASGGGRSTAGASKRE